MQMIAKCLNMPAQPNELMQGVGISQIYGTSDIVCIRVLAYCCLDYSALLLINLIG